MTHHRILPLLAILIASCVAAQEGVSWTSPVDVMKGKEKAVSYRAARAGDVLIVEAIHGDGWHTYALDNAARARKRAGTPALGIEKSTQIKLTGRVQADGKWRQTKPKDLSQADIEWFTWGFEGRTLFATRVSGDGEAALEINAQACKASMCANVDGVQIRVPVGSKAGTFDLDTLIEDGDLTDVKR
jgi:hypothetical protein